MDNVTNRYSIAQKFVFLRLSFGLPGNQRKVKEEILETEADKNLLKVSKTLLDSEELKAISKADALIRTWLSPKKNVALPYDFGVLVIPNQLVKKVNNKLTAYTLERNKLIAEFIKAYPALKEKAKSELGPLYDESEYPSVEEIKTKFTYNFQLFSFAVPEHLKFVDAEVYQQEQEKELAKLRVAAEEITLLMRQNLLDMVDHLKEALTPSEDGKKKRVFQSQVGNIQEFLESFKLRDITGDTALADVVEKAKGLLAGVDADTLRKDEAFKETIKANMESLSGTLKTLVEELPSRKFKFAEYED